MQCPKKLLCNVHKLYSIRKQPIFIQTINMYTKLFVYNVQAQIAVENMQCNSIFCILLFCIFVSIFMKPEVFHPTNRAQHLQLHEVYLVPLPKLCMPPIHQYVPQSMKRYISTFLHLFVQPQATHEVTIMTIVSVIQFKYMTFALQTVYG